MLFLYVDSNEIIDIKTKLSESYISALTSKLNYHFQITNRYIDNDGIDAFIMRKGAGTGSIINVQLKGVSIGSKSMFKRDENFIYYNLKDGYENIPQPAFLFIILFPEESEIADWCKIELEQLIIKKCAYFVPLPQKVGFIKIPLTNVLNEITLPTLFINSSNKEEML